MAQSHLLFCRCSLAALSCKNLCPFIYKTDTAHHNFLLRSLHALRKRSSHLTHLKFPTPKETAKIYADDVNVSFSDIWRACRNLFDFFSNIYGAHAHDSHIDVPKQ